MNLADVKANPVEALRIIRTLQRQQDRDAEYGKRLEEALNLIECPNDRLYPGGDNPCACKVFPSDRVQHLLNQVKSLEEQMSLMGEALGTDGWTDATWKEFTDAKKLHEQINAALADAEKWRQHTQHNYDLILAMTPDDWAYIKATEPQLIERLRKFLLTTDPAPSAVPNNTELEVRP